MPAPSLHVRDYMSTRFATLKENQSVNEAVQLLLARNAFGAAVLDNLGNMVGILSVTDCIEASLKSGFNPGGSGGTVKDLMSPEVYTVDINDSVLDVAKMFMDSHIRRYPVMDDNRVVGVISRLDVLKGLDKIISSGVAV